MQPEAIRERVKALEDEIAKLRATNEEYLSHPIHSSAAQAARTQRELRLQQILDELSQLAKYKV